MINVLIVHYNTPELTEACVKSINKHTPGCKIFIFDNSDKRPFTAHFDNVEIIDNTKGQIIDFDKWVESFPGRKRTIDNHGSAKHMWSVQYMFDKLDKFVLIDSDALIKKDFSDIANSNYPWVGMIETTEMQRFWFKRIRLTPYLLFINTQICNIVGVPFYREHQIYKLDHTGPQYYDTGASFLENCVQHNLIGKQINIHDYIVHFGGGSCTSKKDYKIWLEKNKDLWTNTQ